LRIQTATVTEPDQPAKAGGIEVFGVGEKRFFARAQVLHGFTLKSEAQ
jgi:hypothetical protein